MPEVPWKAPLRRVLVWLALAMGMLSAPVAATIRAPQIGRTHPVGELRVYVDHFAGTRASRGFAPVRWRITNDGLDRRSLSIDLKADYTSHMAESRQSVRVDLEAGESRTLEMLVPVDRDGGRASLRAHLESGRDAVAIGLSLCQDRLTSDGRTIGLVASSRIPDADLAGIAAALPLDDGTTAMGVYDLGTVRSYQAGEQAAALFTAGFDELPQRAAGWSSADTVFVYVDGRLPALEEWSRLIDWARQGGQLAFVGGELDERLSRLEGLRPWRKTSHLEPFTVPGGARKVEATAVAAGFGRIAFVELNGASGPMATEVGPWVIPLLQAFDALEAARISPGAVVRGRSGKPPATLLGRAYQATSREVDGQGPWKTPFPSDQLPILPILGMLTVFSILVGPVNVILSRRRRRPGQLLYAVPLISLAATALVVVYGFLRQGFETEGYVHSLSVLDQEERLATNLMRRQLILGRGGQTLKPLPGTTVLVPDHRADGEVRRVEDDGRELLLAGDFLPVRAKTDHLILANATTRARLEWEAPSGGVMRVTNALGVDLKSLEVMDPAGEVYVLYEAVAAGATVELQKRDGSFLEQRMVGDTSDSIFERARLMPAGFLAEAAAPGPGADDCSVEMVDLYRYHGIVGRLPADDERWGQ